MRSRPGFVIYPTTKKILSVNPAVNRYLSESGKDKWKDDLRFYVLFNSNSVISGRWADDNERLCTTEPRLEL